MLKKQLMALPEVVSGAKSLEDALAELPTEVVRAPFVQARRGVRESRFVRN